MLLPTWAIAQDQPGEAPPAKPAAVVELFEDGAENLLKLLTNDGDGPGQGEADDKVVFSGQRSLKVTQYQRFQRRLPGWNHSIREKPKEGEYRYLRFAWKTQGGNALMLQLHDALDWHIRYNAGPNVFGWQSKPLADKAPAAWTLVTIDLFKDFGERTLTGIAFTIDGGPGNFDHVYLGRTVEDLDRIDASGIAKKPRKLEAKDIANHWQDLTAPDDAVKYRAFWTLVSGGPEVTRFIQEQLAPPKEAVAERKRVQAWIADLDSPTFNVREKATVELKNNLAAAAAFMEAELARTPSLEVRRRLERLLAQRPVQAEDQVRRAVGQRIMSYIAERQKTK